MIRKVTDLNKTAHKSKRKPFSKRRLQYLLHKSEVLSNQYKVERDKFEQMLNKECECGFQMEGKYHDMKVERNSLIDDLSWYKANISRLERENTEQLALLKEFRKLIDYKLTLHQGSSMYREYRSKLDQLGVK